MTRVVAMRGATKDYHLGNVVVSALRGVNLDVSTGEFLSIAGPSGSGKTTILNLIGCIDAPSSGSVLLEEQDVGTLADRRLTLLRLNTIGFIFQSFNLVNVLDVFRNVELPLLLRRSLSRRARTERVRELIDKVGLSDFMKHKPGELSGGQRQRAAIARALVTRPRLVLADEPTANLDSVTGEQILDLMQELNRTEQTTFVFSTHDARVMARASRIIRLRDGLIEEDVRVAAPNQHATTRTALAQSQ